MASLEKNKLTIPRSDIGIVSSVEDIPLPRMSKCTEQIKLDLSKLEKDKCLKCSISNEKTLIEWQRYISAICTNYSRKLNGDVKFTVRVINNNAIGIWRLK